MKIRKNMAVVMLVCAALLAAGSCGACAKFGPPMQSPKSRMDMGTMSGGAGAPGVDYASARGASFSTAEMPEETVSEAAPAPASPSSQSSPDYGPVKSSFSTIASWVSPAAFAQDHNVEEQYIIRTGSIDLRTEDMDVCLAKVNEIAEKYKGSVTGSSITKSYEGLRSGYVTLRLPSESFPSAFSELTQVSELITQSIQTQDAGQEYLAAISRLDALMTEQKTLQQMLKEAMEVQRSRGLGEAYQVLLDTQSRLSDVTAQINEVEMRAKGLADQITRSTVTVSITEQAKLPGGQPQAGSFRWDIGPVFNDAVRNMMENFRGLVHWLIRFFVEGYWIWWLIFILGGRWAWRRVSARWLVSRAKAKSAAEAKDDVGKT